MKRAATRRPATRRAPAKPSAAARLGQFLRGRLPMIIGLALLAVFVHDIFGERGFLAMRRNQREAEKLQQEIRQINQENQQLAEQVKALKTDPKLIERIAREQMGLARPGEMIFKLPPQEETTTTERGKK